MFFDHYVDSLSLPFYSYAMRMIGQLDVCTCSHMTFLRYVCMFRVHYSSCMYVCMYVTYVSVDFRGSKQVYVSVLVHRFLMPCVYHLFIVYVPAFSDA